MPDVIVTLESLPPVSATLAPAQVISATITPGASLGPVPARTGFLATNEGPTALGGGRLLVLDPVAGLAYADPTNAAHYGLAVGFSPRAIQPGETCQLYTEGDWTDTGWAWTPGATLYLGENGLMVETPPPAALFVLIVGSALSAETVFFSVTLSPILKA